MTNNNRAPNKPLILNSLHLWIPAYKIIRGPLLPSALHAGSCRIGRRDTVGFVRPRNSRLPGPDSCFSNGGLKAQNEFRVHALAIEEFVVMAERVLRLRGSKRFGLGV